MSKYFAVAHIDFFGDVLKLHKVEANDWRHAIIKALSSDDEDIEAELQNLPNTLKEVKSYFFDTDSAVDVMEL